jgi:opacity protein-like surface antigen
LYFLPFLCSLQEKAVRGLKYNRLKAVLTAIGLSCGTAIAETPGSSDRFDGRYFGAHAGLGAAAVDFTIGNVPIFDSDASGGLVGIFAGYGWQNDRRFWGIETSAGYSGVKNENLSPVIGSPWLSGEIERVFAVNLLGRVGRVVGDDKDTLVYGLFGPSIVRVQARASLTGIGSVSEGTPYPGLTIGLGVERFFNENISGRVQAVYTKYWEVDDPIETLPVAQSYNLDTVVIQFGVTWWIGR